ncbi:MAG: 2-amino-4-hydroxy-6-hydroxymethyldihydropteridine diphosphokinase [Acidobacteriota bacterium]
MVRVAIALGSNLGNRQAHLDAAVAFLRSILKDWSVSSWIETDHVGVGLQPAFLNGAVAGRWDGEPRPLLNLLLDAEDQAGRQRPFPGSPRTLDLDLILFGYRIVDEPGLVVPHPRFRGRGFVLEPLAEIAPDMVDPVTGQTVSELYEAFKETQS